MTVTILLVTMKSVRHVVWHVSRELAVMRPWGWGTCEVTGRSEETDLKYCVHVTLCSKARQWLINVLEFCFSPSSQPFIPALQLVFLNIRILWIHHHYDCNQLFLLNITPVHLENFPASRPTKLWPWSAWQVVLYSSCLPFTLFLLCCPRPNSAEWHQTPGPSFHLQLMCGVQLVVRLCFCFCWLLGCPWLWEMLILAFLSYDSFGLNKMYMAFPLFCMHKKCTLLWDHYMNSTWLEQGLSCCLCALIGKLSFTGSYIHHRSLCGTTCAPKG